jgi:hypothetical protein
MLCRLMCAPVTPSLALYIKNCMASLSEGFHNFSFPKDILACFQMSFESLSQVLLHKRKMPVSSSYPLLFLYQAASLLLVDKSLLMAESSWHFPGLTACQVFQLLEMYRPDKIAPSTVSNALKAKGIFRRYLYV